MKDSHPSPCVGCTQRCNSGGIGCEAWRIRYLYRQKQINAYARKFSQPRPVETTAFRYAHPEEIRDYLRHSPCEGCLANKTCSHPCATYLQWWDVRMEWLRRKL